MLPDEEQRQALVDTFMAFNNACNFVSKITFEKKLFNKVFLQHIVYRDIREKFRLAAQLAVREKELERRKREGAILSSSKPAPVAITMPGSFPCCHYTYIASRLTSR